MEWQQEKNVLHRKHESGFISLIEDRGDDFGQRRYSCTIISEAKPYSNVWRETDLISDLDRAKQWCDNALASSIRERAKNRMEKAAPDLLEACKAFVEAWDKSHQLEKTDTALRMARKAIEKATGE